MTLKTIFNKPVDRPIEGVIKADDESSTSAKCFTRWLLSRWRSTSMTV